MCNKRKDGGGKDGGGKIVETILVETAEMSDYKISQTVAIGSIWVKETNDMQRDCADVAINQG